jgi:hypothetical protein
MMLRHIRFLALAAALLLAGLALVANACDGADTSATTGSSTTRTVFSRTTTTSVPEGTTGVVEVKGLVDNPMTLTKDTLEGMTVVTITADDPALGKHDYRGVRLSDLFTLFKLKSTVGSLAMTAHANGFVTRMPLQEIQWSPDALLAINDDGTLTVVIPGMESRAWVRDVVVLEFK